MFSIVISIPLLLLVSQYGQSYRHNFFIPKNQMTLNLNSNSIRDLQNTDSLLSRESISELLDDIDRSSLPIEKHIIHWNIIKSRWHKLRKC
jgi:hypothetical protein